MPPVYYRRRPPGLFSILTEQTANELASIGIRSNTMFETAIQGKDKAMAWGIIVGLVALAAILAIGYALIV